MQRATQSRLSEPRRQTPELAGPVQNRQAALLRNRSSHQPAHFPRVHAPGKLGIFPALKLRVHQYDFLTAGPETDPRHQVQLFAPAGLNIERRDQPEVVQRIHKCCRELGGRLDPDASTIHYPLDSPGYLFADLYLEPGPVTIQEIENELRSVLEAKRGDCGRLFPIRHGTLFADRDGELQSLISKLADTKIPQSYADWFTGIALDVPVKLFIHSVHRHDYPHAWFWLQRFYHECAQILFAREGRFFPGGKRLRTLVPQMLTNVPDGFDEFWQNVFSHGVNNWDRVLGRVVDTAVSLKSWSSRDRK